MTAPAAEHIWAPNSQMQIELCRAKEFEVLAGGARGPGKTEGLIWAGTYDIGNPHYRALVLRRTFPELREIMDRTQLTFPKLGARWKESEKRWFFPSGATYEFGYCSTYLEALQYRGHEFQYLAFDDIGDLANCSKIWNFLKTCCRSSRPELTPMMRCSANPGGAAHGFLKRYFVVPCGRDGAQIYQDDQGLTRRFIPGNVYDNPAIVQNDPQYIKILLGLPEVMRRQAFGDWDAGSGAALEELSAETHIVQPFPVPHHWDRFAAFDWGFAHWWVFAEFAVNEDGRVYCLQTIRGRRMLPAAIARAINESSDVSRLMSIVAGADVKSDNKSRADNTPTVQQSFQEQGIYLADANQARRAGLQRLREWVAWKGVVEDPRTKKWVDGQPMLLWFDNPGNRRSIDAIVDIVTDEDDPNMALKVDAAEDTGEGGDDDYDTVRYAMAERIMPARSVDRAPFDMNAPAQLAWEADQQRRHYSAPFNPNEREKPMMKDMGEAY